MQLTVYTPDASSTSLREYAIPTFEGNKGLQALKDTIVSLQANRRQGTRNVKNRAEVSGNNKKFGRQKGGGCARHGDRQAPQFVGGGKALAPRAMDWSQKINKKTKKLAMARALFDKASAGQIVVIERIETPEIKTSAFNELVSKINDDAKQVLVCDQTLDPKTALSARNIERVQVIESDTLGTWHLVRYPFIVVSENGLLSLLERLNRN